MWGDTFLWDVAFSSELVQDDSGASDAIRGSLRRLQGHKVSSSGTYGESP